MTVTIRRRELLAALCGATAAWPLAARAQHTGKLPTIAVLGSDAPSWTAWTAAFAERLRQLGWIEGRTIAIVYRWSEGRPERVVEVADEFVRQKVDIIVTYGGAVAAFKQATRDIPIVFAIAVDPVGIRIIALTLSARLPSIFNTPDFVRAGGLMSYGPDYQALFLHAGDYVDRILRGAKPSDIPVEQPTKFNLVINLTTAKALGLQIPDRLLALADEVIE